MNGYILRRRVLILITGLGVGPGMAADLGASAYQNINQVGFMGVVEKPRNCVTPGFVLEKPNFERDKLIVCLTVQESRNSRHWIMDEKKFLRKTGNDTHERAQLLYEPEISGGCAGQQISQR